MKRDELEVKAEQALLFLHGNAKQHGQLRARSDYLDAWVKSEKARIKSKFPGISQVAAEDEALRHPDYIAALEARRSAAEEWYAALFLREAARAHLDAFQTVSANERVNA